MTKKYELTENVRTVAMEDLYQIKALQDFGDVKAGDLGGYVKSEDNLSQRGNCWIYPNAFVYDTAKVSGTSTIKDGAHICGNAKIENSQISGVDTIICDDALIIDSTVKNGWIHNDSHISNSVINDSEIQGNAIVVDGYIRKNSDILNINNPKITFHRYKDGGIVVTYEACGIYKMPLSKFESGFDGNGELIACAELARKLLIEEKNGD